MVEEFLRTLFVQLLHDNIDYVVPRGWLRLPYAVGKDLDLVIDPDQDHRFFAAVAAAARPFGLLACAKENGGQGFSIDIVAPSAGGGGSVLVGIDARCYISIPWPASFAPYRYRKLFLRDLRCRRVDVGGAIVTVLEPFDEFAVTLHQLLVKRAVGAKAKALEYEQRLADLLADPLVAARVSSDASVSRGGSALDQPLLWRTQTLRWGGWPLQARLSDAFDTLRIRARYSTITMQPIIYLSGPDGAGKTTIANAIKSHLDRAGVRHKDYYSLKIFIRALTKRLALLKKLGRRNEGTTRSSTPDLLFLTEDDRDRDPGTAGWKVRKYLALVVGFLDTWIGYLYVMLWRLAGYTVVIETAAYDLFFKYHMPDFPRTRTWLQRCMPRPTLGLLLVADPQAIHARKPELLVAEISAYYVGMKAMLDALPTRANYVSIPTDGELAHAIAAAVSSVSKSRLRL